MLTVGIRPRRAALVRQLGGAVSLAALALTGAAGAALAQDGGLEEVVVTARRQAENVQSAPVSVTSLSGDFLANMNITRVQEIASVSPNLVISDAPSNGTGTIVYIRGIGAISVSAHSDPPITIYIDGVVQARPTGNAFDLPDLDRVEVLRGPQGTLFGRNTVGGAVSIYTKAPTDEFGGKVDFSYGRYSDFGASLVLNTGRLGNSPWRTKLTVQRTDQDGYIRTPGRSRNNWAGYERSTGFSFTAAADLTDAFSLTNRVDYNKVNTLPAYQMFLANGVATTYFNNSVALGGPPPVISAEPQDLIYLDPRRQFDPWAKAWGDTLTLTYDVAPEMQIKSITGYRWLDQRQSGQIGGSALLGIVSNPVNPANPVDYVNGLMTPNNKVKQKQISQELQAQGKVGEFNYATGLYFFREKTTESQLTIGNSVAATGLTSTRTARQLDYRITSRSLAAYGQAGWRPAALDDKLEISAGVRYTKDRKSIRTQQVQNGVLQGPQVAAQSWDNFGWSTSVSYQWTRDVMTYFRAASAYRSGGFNPSQVGAPAFNPEKAISIEAGFKTEWLERRLRLNATAFKTFYDDLQINQRNAANNTNFIVNAAKANYQGFELETVMLPGGGFQIDGTLGYVLPKYKEYIFRDAAGGQTNLAGAARFPFVSRWTANIGLQYRSEPTAIGVFTPRVDYAFNSSHYFQPVDLLAPNNPRLGSGAERNLKARLTLSDIPVGTGTLENLQVQVYGTNLLNHRYILSGVDLGSFASVAFSRPRTYGVRISADF